MLHCAGSNLKALQIIFAVYPQEEIWNAVQSCDKYQATLLHNVARNPKTLKYILSLLTVVQKAQASGLMDKKGRTYIDLANDSDDETDSDYDSESDIEVAPAVNRNSFFAPKSVNVMAVNEDTPGLQQSDAL